MVYKNKKIIRTSTGSIVYTILQFLVVLVLIQDINYYIQQYYTGVVDLGLFVLVVSGQPVGPPVAPPVGVVCNICLNGPPNSVMINPDTEVTIFFDSSFVTVPCGALDEAAKAQELLQSECDLIQANVTVANICCTQSNTGPVATPTNTQPTPVQVPVPVPTVTTSQPTMQPIQQPTADQFVNCPLCGRVGGTVTNGQGEISIIINGGSVSTQCGTVDNAGQQSSFTQTTCDSIQLNTTITSICGCSGAPVPVPVPVPAPVPVPGTTTTAPAVRQPSIRAPVHSSVRVPAAPSVRAPPTSDDSAAAATRTAQQVAFMYNAQYNHNTAYSSTSTLEQQQHTLSLLDAITKQRQQDGTDNGITNAYGFYH